MSTPPILRTDGGRVAVLTVDRPGLGNSVDEDVLAALEDHIDDISGDTSVGAVVVGGAGPDFCVGVDVAALAALESAADFGAHARRLANVLDRLAALDQPVVAALHGATCGPGLELALACDLRVAEADARLGFPDVDLGLLPAAGGTARLPRVVPPAVALQMLMTGELIDAAEAHRIGLVNSVVAPGTATRAAVALARGLADRAPLAVAALKRLADANATSTLADAVSRERDEATALFATADRAEGVAAHLAGRAPAFEGR